MFLLGVIASTFFALCSSYVMTHSSIRSHRISMVFGDVLKTIGLKKEPAQIEFLPSNTVVQVVAGTPLSEVALAAGVEIKYKCKKGECGTCEVNINNKWVKACQTSVPKIAAGETLKVTVKPIVPAPAKKPATFFTPASFVEGIVNNAAGVVGFVTVAAKVDDEFETRMKKEAELAAKVAAAKAAKAAAEKEKKV